MKLKSGVLAEPVLVGRERELEELQLYINSAVQGKGKTVFLSGEAGSGKTRLAREFLNSAVKLGVAVMAGWCLSDSQAPFFPFIEAFNSYYAPQTEEGQAISFQQHKVNLEVPTQVEIEEIDVSSWLAGPKSAAKTGKVEMLSPEVWKDQALAAVAKTLHTIALQVPVVLFIEDLHWADSASLALLHYLSRVVKDADKILLLATFRSEDLTSDAEGHPHPLAETLRMMRREELFSEIKLSNLNQANVSRLAETMLGSCVQPEFAEKLTAQSGGSPLFIVESLRMLNEHGGLIKDGACIRLDIDKVSVPSKVKDVILRRVGCLLREQRRVLDAASVIGEEFNVEFLSGVLERDILNVLETLSAISESTSLVVDVGDCYRFDHARSRETLYEELSPSLRKGYHNRIAEKLENASLKSLPLSNLSYHYDLAGNKEKAAKYALAAGKDELAKYSNAQAIKHFQYVLGMLPEGHDDERKEALEGLGDAYHANSNHNEAMKTFDKLGELETGRRKLRAIRKAMDVAYEQGSNPDLLLEYAKKAEDLGIDDRLEMARIIDNRAKAWGWSGRGDWKMDLADYNFALQVFEEENSITDVAEALWRSGSLTTMINPGVGFSRLLRSVAIFREIGDVRNEVKATNWLAHSLFLSGVRFPEARRVYSKVIAIGEKLGMFLELSVAYGRLSSMDAEEENETDSLLHFSKAFEYSQKADVEWLKWAFYSSILRFYSIHGELEQAENCFDKMSKMPPELLSNVTVIYGYYMSKGVYFAAKNQWDKAKQAFDEVFQAMKKFKNPQIERDARLTYSWVLKRQGKFEEAEAQLAAVQALLLFVEERMSYTTVQLNVMVPRKVVSGEEFNMRLDLANVSRRSITIVNVEGIALPEFTIVNLPPFCSLQDSSLAMKEKRIGPYELETIKLRIKAMKCNSFCLNPEINFIDELGCNRTSKSDSIIVSVETAKPSYEVLAGRVPTGSMELDKLLLGGIPEKYAVALVSSASEERQKIIENYVKAGLTNDETTLYLTVEPGRVKALPEQLPKNTFFFVCNPKVDLMVKDQPNVYKLKGTDNLTDIDIALAKTLRQLNSSKSAPRRACVEIVSDVLLQHHAVITRKWISGLIQELRAKGFTIIAVVDPLISAEEVPAITELFDGEIRISEEKGAEGLVKMLRILRLQGQSYLKDELPLG